MLEQHVGPFFIMVSEMIRRDFVRFMVIPGTILPAFAVAFCVLFKSIGADSNPDAVQANANFGQSAFTLVLLGVGLGDEVGETMTASADARVMILLLLYILLVPIMAMNLLVAMMADTYVDVRSASLNRWSLKQAQYLLSRQRFAQLLGISAHFPKMDGGYAFTGQYEEFFTGASIDTESFAENLRKSTFDEARRASRLAEVCVEGIEGLNEILVEQLASAEERARASEAKITAMAKDVALLTTAMGRQRR